MRTRCILQEFSQGIAIELTIGLRGISGYEYLEVHTDMEIYSDVEYAEILFL
jgi:hypothetical protein